jgi:photosystem II stability/assembly factor-like uncharacterized protein
MTHRLLLGILSVVPAIATMANAQRLDPKLYSDLHWRFIGPDGNRVIAVVGEPGESRVYYAGAASGGLFKSTDGGTRWEPLTDSLPFASVGSIAIAPSDHNVLYVGTGETFIRSNVSIGNGLWKSIDAGKTWTHVGLEKTGRIGRIVVDPRDARVVYAAALGTGYGTQQERGVYRSKDGGSTWERVLFVNDSTGASDIAVDAHDPNVLLAGMWQFVIHPWSVESGGHGSGVYQSRDGGTTWRRLTDGLPRESMGKIAVHIARRDPNRMYALIETKDPGLYRSDDGGRHWRLVNQDHDLLERPHYYTRFTVAPDDENRLYFVSVRFSWSLDGGLTKAPNPPRAGGDLHDVWIDPENADRMMVGDDGGVGISVDRGKSWTRIVLPNAQMYHVFVDNRVPYSVYGNRQDGYSYMGTSNSRENGRSIGLWTAVGGCESGFAVPDTVDPNIVWSGCYDAGLERYDNSTRMARAVEVWPEAGYGVPPKDMKYRWNWTFPIAISPHDHNTVYVGSQYIHRTRNGGQSWEVISPDLTTNDTTKQRSSGGLVTDNLYVESSIVVFAIAESPTAKGVIWAGTMDGLVQLTRDDGKTWTNVTPNGVIKFAAVSNVEPSKFDAGTAYISVDAHQMNDRDPYIYKTTDYGKSWRLISGGIPKSTFSYVHCVREDPVRRGMVYAGTENGVWFSLDDGANWQPLQNNLPHAPVSWLVVQPHFDDLVISTYGRGFWILDDVAALRNLDRAVNGSQRAAMLPVRDAYRFRKLQNRHSAPNSLVGGEDPPYGAAINVFVRRGVEPESAVVIGATAERTTAATEPNDRRTGLRNTPAAPSARADSARQRAEASADTLARRDSTARRDSVRFTITDAQGRVVRRLTVPPARTGLNRVWWDLRYDSPRAAKLRVPPPAHAHVRVNGSRPLVTWDLDIVGGQVGPLVAPGTYTVVAVVGRDSVSAPIRVLRDPNTTATDADIAAQLAESLDLRSDMNATVDMIDQAEWVRKQIADLSFLFNERKKDARERAVAGDGVTLAGGARDTATALAALDSSLATIRDLEKKMLALEGKLYDTDLTGAREDAFRSANQLYEKLASVASDVASASADWPPTDQQKAVHALLKQQLTAVRGEFEKLMTLDVNAFNQRLGGNRIVP